MSSDEINLVFPIVGAVAANILWFSSVPKVLRCVQKQSMGALNPFPMMFMTLAAVSFTVYSLTMRSKTSSLLVFVANFPGVPVGLFYIFSTLPLCTKLQQNIITYIVMGTTSTLMLAAFLSIQYGDIASPDYLLGHLAIVIFVVFTASPLQAAPYIYQQQDSSSMNLPLSVTLLINCICWTAFSIAIDDIFILVPEVFGVIVAMIQIGICLRYPDKSKENTQVQTKPQTLTLVV